MLHQRTRSYLSEPTREADNKLQVGLDSTTTSSLVKLVSPFFEDAKSGILWLWVRSQATAESFPNFLFFLSSSRPRGASPSPPPLPFPLFVCSLYLPATLLPLPYDLYAPLMRCPFLPGAALARRAFPFVCFRALPLVQCLFAPPCWLISHFFLIFRDPLTLT